MAHVDGIISTFFQSSADDRVAGINWYSRAFNVCCDLGEKYDLHTDIVAGVISALSPGVRWEVNVVDAEIMLRAWASDLDYRYVKVGSYGPQKYKAAQILDRQLDREGIIKVLRGQKTIAFFLCIATNGVSDTPCIDGHAFNVWNSTNTSLKKVPSISDKTYRIIQDAYREASKIISTVTGKYYTASQIQAITWVTHRRTKSI